MWQGKKKALTFSFDDAVTQDIRLIEILNKYGLKGTFNLNSGRLGTDSTLYRNERTVTHIKIKPEDIAKVYAGHEVAAHTVTHPNLTEQDDAEVIHQVVDDQKALSALVGYPVVGMAYPCGGVNNDDRVAEIIRKNSDIRYARTITSTYSFEKQSNLLRFNPTVYFVEWDKMNELADEFLSYDGEDELLFYIWGHSYELDAEYLSWEQFDGFCKKVSGKADVFYGTNKEVLL